MHYRAGVEVSIKRDGTVVTEADRAVEHLLRESIGSAVPEDALLGEELGRLGDSERVWILDPIDGTSYFSRRDPNWRVHVAFEASGRTEVAVVTAPALGRQWWAARGGGAFESSWPRLGDEVRLSVTSTWDHAPWILLVEEAGGRFTDRTGGHGGDVGGGLYSNSGLHTELLAALGYPDSP
jgi:histidinol-phosphatase